MEKYLTPAEVAEMLGLSVVTLNRWRTQGTGPRYLKPGGRVRYRPEDVRAWAEASAVETEQSQAA